MNILAYFHAKSMVCFEATQSDTTSPESMTFFQKMKTLLAGVSIARPTMPAALQDSILPYEHIRIAVDSGLYLGALYRAADSGKVIVLLFHGYKAEKSCLLKEAELFHEMGYGILLIDFRGSGESSESYTTVGYFEAEDVTAAFNYSRDSLGYQESILYGQSMGGAAILRAIAVDEISPEAIIIESVFDRMLTTVEHRFEAMGIPVFPTANLLVFWGGRQLGFDAFDNNPIDYAASVNCPALFLHGENDTRAYLREGRAVFDNIPSQKYFVPFENIAHQSIADAATNKWEASVDEFLQSLPHE
ncbi:MAG: alpha/beta fold hydrolase [Candidatus Zixiibacteriota bacterium]